MKLIGKVHRQSHVVAGVCIAEGDYDQLLCEALRVALGIDTYLLRDDWQREDTSERYDRILQLINAYIDSPEGREACAPMLMARLACSILDVVPLEQRRAWAR